MEGGNGPAGARRGCGRGWARRARPGGKGGADTGVSRKGKGGAGGRKRDKGEITGPDGHRGSGRMEAR